MKRPGIILLFPLVICLVTACNMDVETTKKAPPATSNGANATGDQATGTGAPSEKQDAEEVLTRSIARAKKLNKNVFVHIGAPW